MSSVEGIAPGGSVEVLKPLHLQLDHHFRMLHDQRRALHPPAPVFALEHDLVGEQLELLLAAVRGAVADGLDVRYRAWWLPFVVFAAEIGYDYVGGEFWPLWGQRAPGWEGGPQWNVPLNRKRIRQWFRRFADDYGGAEPRGGFATNFTIIAWPITHAVMPADLQRQMAQLLFESRGVLNSELLADPDVLGACLASRTGGYSERFRILCANQSLLGQVAVALLSGDEEDSPYLVRSTLVRLVAGLSNEQASRSWLSRARQSANVIRSSGFLPTGAGAASAQPRRRVPAFISPRLFLRSQHGGWQPYLELPDLTPLQTSDSQVDQEIRSLRARVEGHPRPLARGRLLWPDKVPLSTWPRPGTPAIELERGSEAVNKLIAEHCSVDPGPWWVFGKRSVGDAIEVKGKFVRPGNEYCLVGRVGSSPPSLPWIVQTITPVEGVHVFEVTVPQIISAAEVEQLAAVGLTVASDVSIRPVGLVPKSWDGDGVIEWLAGEPAMLAVRSAHAADKCAVTVDHGLPILLEFPEGQPELFFALENLVVGTHDVNVALLTPESDRALFSGSLAITIRDQHTSREAATEGTAIRLFTTPARPKMPELWDGRASLSIDGPLETKAELSIALCDGKGRELAKESLGISVPFSDGAWEKLRDRVLRKKKLFSAYEEAESCEISVFQNGVGFASLVCERGFHPLRWVLAKRRRGQHEARLIDRTGNDDTQVHLFSVEAPLVGKEHDPHEPITVPATGGLLQATSGTMTAAIILPPEPNELRQSHPAVPRSSDGSLLEVQRLIEGHRRWLDADVPADPFAHHQQQRVLEAVTTAFVSLIAGHRWANLERKRSAASASRKLELLDEMGKLVGEASKQRTAAQQIGRNLWQWADSPAALSEGFADAIELIVTSSGMGDPRAAADFLLALASRPGSVANWAEPEKERLLSCALISPALIRAARFAVLGTDSLRDASEQPNSGAAR
ncbi:MULTISPECIES: hypothetical protein [unclassified Streptomyces]|uniref:hypothetical protein n=1 Tax=unclassified Streptomyces TaxID=2593676 RepID=UPI002E2BA059|nr:hypothetical protein [Streptomyces sp. NBC_00223]